MFVVKRVGTSRVGQLFIFITYVNGGKNDSYENKVHVGAVRLKANNSILVCNASLFCSSVLGLSDRNSQNSILPCKQKSLADTRVNIALMKTPISFRLIHFSSLNCLQTKHSFVFPFCLVPLFLLLTASFVVCTFNHPHLCFHFAPLSLSLLPSAFIRILLR